MAVPSPPSPSKDDLRRAALQARRDFARSLSPELRARLERQLVERLVPHLIGAGTIGLYHPLKDEISPLGLLDRLSEGQQAVLPWFADRGARMLWRRAPAVEPGPWGVLQPSADSPAVAPDTVIVPLVLADEAGSRIGHGKGHYDRALAALRQAGPVRAFGVGWDIQLSDATLPSDPWDVPLEAIATPGKWIDCR